MTETAVTSALRAQKFNKEYFSEYVRANQFEPYMGADFNKIIHVKTGLEGSGRKGETIDFPLVGKLSGVGRSGNQTLEGYEEDLNNYSDIVTVDWIRNAVKVTLKEAKVTEVDIMMAAKDALKVWGMEQLRDAFLDAFFSPVVDGTTKYEDASEAQKDAWLVANTDRVRFGASGYASGDHSAGLGNLDTTNDKFTVTNLRLARRLLKQASPAIRPIQIDKYGEMYVCFASSPCFRDLKASLDTIHQNAAPRSMRENPIFFDGDLLVDNVIVKEVPEMDLSVGDLATAGASNVATAPNFICGAQALGLAYSVLPSLVADPNMDYKFRHGVAHQECRGVKKLMYNNVQNGVFTLYTTAVADA